MMKTYDLNLNITKDKMVKRENIRLTDKEKMIYWDVRKPIIADKYDGDEFEWRSFDAIDEFKDLYEEGKITDNQFVDLMQTVIDKRHDMSRICDDFHEEPASPVVKHEPVKASFIVFLMLKNHKCRRDAASIMLAFNIKFTEQEQWDFWTILFDGVFKYDDSPRYYLHIFADDDSSYLMNPTYLDGDIYLSKKFWRTVFSESEIAELQKKAPHINLKACTEPVEESDYVD